MKWNRIPLPAQSWVSSPAEGGVYPRSTMINPCGGGPAPDGAPRKPPFERPRRNLPPGRPAARLVPRVDPPLTQHPPVRQPADRAMVEVSQRLRRLESVRRVVDLPTDPERGAVLPATAAVSTV